MKNVITSICLVITLATSGLLQAAEITDLGLSKIKDTRSSVAYLKVDQDFSHYDKIAIADIKSDEVVVKQPDRSRIHSTDWEMDEERKQRVESMHRKAFDREFAEAQGLELVDTVDENTLVLVTRLREVAPTVGYDPSSVPGRTRVYSDSTGSVAIEMFLLDGKTGEVVAAVGTARELGGHYWTSRNSVTNGSDVQLAFNAWAKQAREAVENLPELAGQAAG
jgi:hypothetical protein